MGKRIVFCADGTWNGPEQETGVSAIDDDDDAGELASAAVTNVVKMFANLAGQETPESASARKEKEKVCAGSAGELLQVAKYIHGVGDSQDVVVKLLGGMFGMGVVARIVRGYTYISRNYREGDQVHILGFSRGAYTARALAGLIASVGLLDVRKYDPDDKAQAYRMGIAAWSKAKSVKVQGTGRLSLVANRVLGFAQQVLGRSLPDDALLPDVRMESVAVWDTVGSMGIPVYAGDQRFDVFRFTDTALSPKVANGFHAMALDELRIDFPVTRWDERDGVRQVWFVGAHSDVGGGYPPGESRLSDTALDWMTARLREVDVLFGAPPDYAPNTDAGAQAIHAPWEKPPFNIMPHSPRKPNATDTFHASVVERWKTDPGYRPEALIEIPRFDIDSLKVDK